MISGMKRFRDRNGEATGGNMKTAPDRRLIEHNVEYAGCVSIYIHNEGSLVTPQGQAFQLERAISGRQ